MSTTTQVSLKEAQSLVSLALQAGLVPMIHGSPAIGKSSIVAAIAEHFNLKLIDIRLSQMEPTDLNGLPFFKDGKASYNPFDLFPLEDTPVPEGYSGWLIFFDEANAAPLSVQAACYGVVLDRKIGQYNLNKRVAICLAGNLETDGAITNPMSTAMQSRLVHIEVGVVPKEFIEWAEGPGNYDHRITSYLGMMPEHVYTFSPDHTDKTYASPRTWGFTNKILKVIPKVEKEHIPLLSGIIGEGVARSFYGFLSLEEDVPKIAQIEANPETIKIPDNVSIQWAITGVLAAYATPDNADKLIKFARRLPVEFQVISLKKMIAREPSLTSHDAVKEWRRVCAKPMLA